MLHPKQPVETIFDFWPIKLSAIIAEPKSYSINLNLKYICHKQFYFSIPGNTEMTLKYFTNKNKLCDMYAIL